jgi:hypothetical protein
MRARWAIVFGMAAMVLAGVQACTAGDDTLLPANPREGGAGDESTTGGGDGTANLPDTAVPPGAPLCSTYGADIATRVTNDLLTAVGQDCRISAYFTALQDPSHLHQCLEKQIGTFFQCPGVTYTSDDPQKPCRSMGDAHKGLGLRNADFQAFIDDTVAVMRKDGISDKDITAVLPTFVGTKTAIVQSKGIGDEKCTCPDMIYDGGYCGTDAGIIDAGDGGDGAIDGAVDTGTDSAAPTDASDSDSG